MNMLRPVPRVNGLAQRAPGGAPVGMNYVQMLAGSSARRVGVNGTRGLYNAVVGKGPGVTVVPLIRTPAQGVLVSARSMFAAGTTKVGPGGAQRPGGLAGMGSGSWDNEAAAQAAMGKPLQAGEFYSNAPPYPLWDPNTWQHKRACELGQKGMETPCSRYGTPFGRPFQVTQSANPGEAATLRSIKDVLSQFEARLRAGTIDPDSAFPTGTATIAALADEGNRSLYNDVTTLHDTLIPSARTVGRMYRSLNSASASPTTPVATTPATTTPATPTTPTTPTYVYVGQPSGGSSDPYLTNIPNDLYGGYADPVTGTVAAPSGGSGTMVTAPGAKAAIAPAKSKAGGAAIAVGLVVVLGGAYAFSRRKRKSRSR